MPAKAREKPYFLLPSFSSKKIRCDFWSSGPASDTRIECSPVKLTLCPEFVVGDGVALGGVSVRFYRAE